MKRYIIVYLSCFFLAAAAPIALNGGSSPFDGGTLTTPALAPTGTTAAPSYSHSAETDLGLFRHAADTLGAIVDTNLEILFEHTTSYSTVRWATNLTYTSTDVNNPAVIGTDADTGIIAQSRAMDFVQNGDAFAGLRTSASGSLFGGFCLDASNTAPCITAYPVSSGKFYLSSINNSNWTSVIDLGDDGNIKSAASSSGYYFDPDNTTTFGSNSDSSMTLTTSSAYALQFVNSPKLIGTSISSRFMTLSTSAGAPTAGDCDADAERGRMVLDTTNSRLYVCGGGTRLWDYYTLVDDGAI